MKLMSQVFWVNALILLITLFLVTAIVVNNLRDDFLKNAIAFNESATINLKDYFLGKEDFIYKTVRDGLEKRSSGNESFFDYLELETDSHEYHEDIQKQMKKNFIKYIENRYGMDNSVTGIITYVTYDSQAYAYTRTGSLMNSVSKELIHEIEDNITNYSTVVRFFAATFKHYAPYERSYAIIQNIYSQSTFEPIGVIHIDFSTIAVTQFLDRYYENAKGDFVVLTDGGELIYDSSGMWYDHPEKLTEILKDTKTYHVNQQRLDRLGLTVCGLVNTKTLSSDFFSGFWGFVSVFIFAFLLFLTVSFLFGIRYTRQINTIKDAMISARKGNVSKRIPEGNYSSELDTFRECYNKTLDDLQSYIDKFYIAELSKRQFQLLALQAQINPHFLYNTLEAIRMKALASGAKETAEMTYILAKLLRNSIKEIPFSTVSEEIKNCQNYLELHEIRYQNAFSYTFDIPEELQEVGVIRHMLQPLAENYILHGFDINRKDNQIEIMARQCEDKIIFSLCDNGIGIHPEKLRHIQEELKKNENISVESIGLLNINQRICLIYGEECGVKIKNRRQGTHVEVTIGTKSVEELVNHVQSIDRR